MKFSEFYRRYDLPLSTDALLRFLYADTTEENLFSSPSKLQEKGYTESATISQEVFDDASSYIFDLEFEIVVCLDKDEQEVRKKEDLIQLLEPLEQSIKKTLAVENEEDEDHDE